MKREIVRTIGVFLQVLFCTAAVSAQEQQQEASTDTSRSHQVVIVDPGVSLGKATLLLPPWLAAGATAEPFPVPGARPGLPPPLPGGAYALHVDLISPYLLQRQRDQQLNTLTNVLGAVEWGGAAYIAYRHIKKYGLFR